MTRASSSGGPRAWPRRAPSARASRTSCATRSPSPSRRSSSRSATSTIAPACVRHLDQVGAEIRKAHDVIGSVLGLARGEPVRARAGAASRASSTPRATRWCCRPTSPSRSPSIRRDLTVLCDPILLERVFSNLYLNAIEALEGRGRGAILTRAWRGDARTYLEVEDDGPGLDPTRHRPRLRAARHREGERHRPRPRALAHHHRGARRRDHRDHRPPRRRRLPLVAAERSERRVRLSRHADRSDGARAPRRARGARAADDRARRARPARGARARPRRRDEPHGPLGPARRPGLQARVTRTGSAATSPASSRRSGPGARGVAVGDRVMVAARALVRRLQRVPRRVATTSAAATGSSARTRRAATRATSTCPTRTSSRSATRSRFEDAAAAAALHAHRVADGLRQGPTCGPGRRCVVHAAGSGVSSIAIQLVQARRARASSRRPTPTTRRERARALGADEVIVTSEQDYVAEVQAPHRQARRRRDPRPRGRRALREERRSPSAWGGRDRHVRRDGGLRGEARPAPDLLPPGRRSSARRWARKGDLLEALPLHRSPGKLRARRRPRAAALGGARGAPGPRGARGLRQGRPRGRFDPPESRKPDVGPSRYPGRPPPSPRRALPAGQARKLFPRPAP